MGNKPLALQKVNELRSVVSDGSDLAEMVDTLATLLVLRQDMTNPMLGAKVMFYEKPDGEWVDITFDDYRELVDNGDLFRDVSKAAWEIATDSDNEKFDRYDDTPWYVRWRRIDGDNNKTIPNGTIEHRFKRYMQWDHETPVEVEREDVPDEILAESGGAMNEIADARDGERWMIYGVGGQKKFKRRKLVPCEEFVPHRAIVIEASIAEQPSGASFWDPNRGEYTTPDDYPMGTVNVVLPEDPYKQLGRDYIYEMKVETSVTPADGDTNGHVYTPGWPQVQDGIDD